MLYAQFYSKSAISDELIESCGDRSVIILDGRHSSIDNGRIAASECVKRGYLAWAIFKGDTFTRSKRLSGPNWPNTGRMDDSAMSANWGY